MKSNIFTAAALSVMLLPASCALTPLALMNTLNADTHLKTGTAETASSEQTIYSEIYFLDLKAIPSGGSVRLEWQDYIIETTDPDAPLYRTPTSYRVIRSVQSPWEGFESQGERSDGPSDSEKKRLSYSDTPPSPGRYFYRLDFTYITSDTDGKKNIYRILSEAVEIKLP